MKLLAKWKLISFTISVIYFSIAIPVCAQNPDEIINVNNFNSHFLEFLIKTGIDSVRISQGLNSLQNDSILYLAAKDQAEYQFKLKNELSHFQKTKNKKTPQDRVNYYGGEGYYAGENLSYSFIQVPVQSAVRGEPSKVINSYAEAATDFVQGWIHSPHHYENIIKPDYLFTAVAVSLDKKDNKLVACQVFAFTDSSANTGFSKDLFPYDNGQVFKLSNRKPGPSKYPEKYQWKLKPKALENDLKLYKIYRKQVENFVLFIYHDSLCLYLGNENYARNFFNRRRDGISLDLAYMDQYLDDSLYHHYPCARNHNSIFSGLIRKPVYKRQIFKNLLKLNKTGPYKNAVYVKLYPYDSLINEAIKLHVVFIKRRRVVDIIPSVNNCYRPLSLYPKQMQFMELDTALLRKTKCFPRITMDTLKITVSFRLNEFEPDSASVKKIVNYINRYGRRLTQANITAFSSVEGNEDKNRDLAEKRATSIYDIFKSSTDSSFRLKKTSNENWELFFKQIRNSRDSMLLSMDTSEIREFLKGDTLEQFLQKKLDKQRYTFLSLWSEPAVTDSNIDTLLMDEYEKTSINLLRRNSLNRSTKIPQKVLKRLGDIQSYMYGRYLKGKVTAEYIRSVIPLPFELNYEDGGKPFLSMKYNQALFEYEFNPSASIQVFYKATAVAAIPGNCPIAQYNNVVNIINDFNYSGQVPVRLKAAINYLESVHFDKQRIMELRFFLSLLEAKRIYENNPINPGKYAKSANKIIFKTLASLDISDEYRIETAKHFAAFGEYSMAKIILQPVLDRSMKNYSLFKFGLYLDEKLYELGEPGVIQHLVDAQSTLTDMEWVDLFFDRCLALTRILDTEAVHKLFIEKLAKIAKDQTNDAEPR